MAAFMAAQWLAEDSIDFLPFVQGAPETVQYAIAFVVVGGLIRLGGLG
jgi:membrane protein required for colicin V production